MRIEGSSMVAGVVFLALGAGSAAAAAPAAKAKGKWTVEGVSVAMTHARTFREADPFGRGTNPCVLVSNAAVPDEAVPDGEEGIGALLDLMRGGEVVAFQVCFDASGEQLRNVNDVFTFHPGVSPGRFGLQGFHRFAAKGEAGRIAGKLTGSGTTMEGAPWSVDVDLSAEMPEE